MNTDYLSKETYEGIFREANILAQLAMSFAVLTYDCQNESEYLDQAEKLTRELMEYSDGEMDDMFLGKVPKKEKLHSILNRILSNIERIRGIPFEKPTLDFLTSGGKIHGNIFSWSRLRW